VSKLNEDQMSDLLTKNDLETYVQLKDDGSLRPENDFRNTHELCILAKEDEIFQVITKLMTVLKGECKVNKSCGLHVHLDMRNKDPKKAYTNLFVMQKLLYSMCPKSRHSGSFSIPEMSYREIDFKRMEGMGDRYKGINPTAFSKYGTIEVRIHSGTLNPKKINNWIRILLKIVNLKQRENVKIIDTLEEAQKELKLTGKLNEYVVARLKEFEEKHNGSITKIVI
jgi:hypothetical protein